jgi:hypothetical protein
MKYLFLWAALVAACVSWAEDGSPRLYGEFPTLKLLVGGDAVLEKYFDQRGNEEIFQNAKTAAKENFSNGWVKNGLIYSAYGSLAVGTGTPVALPILFAFHTSTVRIINPRAFRILYSSEELHYLKRIIAATNLSLEQRELIVALETEFKANPSGREFIKNHGDFQNIEFDAEKGILKNLSTSDGWFFEVRREKKSDLVSVYLVGGRWGEKHSVLYYLDIGISQDQVSKSEGEAP